VVDPVTEGVGGWGSIGSTCSDNYTNQPTSSAVSGRSAVNFDYRAGREKTLKIQCIAIASVIIIYLLVVLDLV